MIQYVDAVYEEMGQNNMPMTRYMAYTIFNRDTLEEIGRLPPTTKTIM